VPFWRSQLPDQLVEITTIFFIACAAALCREIKLIPPIELSFRRQRRPIGFGAADEITADGDHCLAALRPKCRNDVGCSCAPIKAREDRPLNFKDIHEGNYVESNRGLLAISESFI